LRLPRGSLLAAAAAQALYRPDVGRFAAQSRGAAELRARLAVEPEPAAPQPWAALSRALAPVEVPVQLRAARLAPAELARPGAPAALLLAWLLARRAAAQTALDWAELAARRASPAAGLPRAARLPACSLPAAPQARAGRDASPAARLRPAASA